MKLPNYFEGAPTRICVDAFIEAHARWRVTAREFDKRYMQDALDAIRERGRRLDAQVLLNEWAEYRKRWVEHHPSVLLAFIELWSATR